MKNLKKLAALAVLAAVTAVGVAAAAQESTGNEDLVLFRKLIAERDAAARKLYALDRQAARRLAAGENPVELYAQQQDEQDKVDQSELRLQMLSLRVDEPVPPLPDVEAEAKRAESAGDRDKLDAAFNRGRGRAVGFLRQETLDILASLDYSAYLIPEARLNDGTISSVPVPAPVADAEDDAVAVVDGEVTPAAYDPTFASPRYEAVAQNGRVTRFRNVD